MNSAKPTIHSGRPVGSAALIGERVERRLAGILAADVAGNSRLIGADEESTLRPSEGASPRADRSQDSRAPGPHCQGYRRRRALVVRQRRRRAALRDRGAGGDERSGTPLRHRTAGTNSGLASIEEISLSRTATSLATASTSQPGSKAWPSPAASACRRACRKMRLAGQHARNHRLARSYDRRSADRIRVFV